MARIKMSDNSTRKVAEAFIPSTGYSLGLELHAMREASAIMAEQTGIAESLEFVRPLNHRRDLGPIPCLECAAGSALADALSALDAIPADAWADALRDRQEA